MVSPAAPARLHADEVDTDVGLVRRLLATQFPAWAGLPVTPLASSGTDNAMYRLGETLVARLPRVERASGQVAKEHAWLPRLAPRLPLAIPEPLAKGAPGEGYPWAWSVYGWIEGVAATSEPFADPVAAARSLASFLTALWAIDASTGPPPGRHNFYRGQAITVRDQVTRAAIATMAGEIDADLALEAWDGAMAAPPWTGPPVWVHGDVMPGNLIVAEGRLSAVIDFGGLGVGDPACDLMGAWSVFGDREARRAFRDAVAVDDATWARGRAWALHQGLMAAPYYRDTKPDFAAAAKRTIGAVLADIEANR